MVSVIALWPGTPAFADFRSGLDAYNAEDYATAMREWLPLAETGQAEAQYYLGELYRVGDGVVQDFSQAVKWYRRAAIQGHSIAQNSMGVRYEKGQGVVKDEALAVSWYRKAAEQGLKHAQSNLGIMYQLGRGVAINYPEAAKWYRLSAEQGYATAQFNLALMYVRGRGLPQNYRMAVDWFQAAAEQGDIDAWNSLGVRYENGQGVEVDMLKAEKLYRKAARAGSTIAENNLRALLAKLNKEVTSTESRLGSSIPKAVANSHSSKLAPIRPDDIAVIIGNSNYKKQGKNIPNVDPAYADADAFKQWVIRAKGVREGNIIYLRDATSAQMISAFGSERSYKGQLFNWTKPGISDVYIYYSGHGAPAGDEKSAYLVPSDTNSATVQLTGYPLATLYNNLTRLPAKSITVVLEACFSGASQNGNVISRTSGLYISPKLPTAPSNITVISAGRADQVASWEEDGSQSLFTKFFLMGMGGKADNKPYGDGNGDVSFDELNKYLSGTLTYFARRYYGRDQNAQIVVGVQ